MNSGLTKRCWCGVLVLRHSNEGEEDGLPTELRKASAVADILLEPIEESEEATVPKREDGEESIAAGDKDGNEETSSKARTINSISGGLTVTNGTSQFSNHRSVLVHPR
jgi:hypothetical protein